MKILLCDDDLGILEVTKIMLESQGHQVLPLSNGRAIIKKTKDYCPDLIFLDVWMPGIDGREIMKLLKKDPETDKIPVIVMSALNNTDQIASEESADGFLTKPFEMDNLFKTVNQFSKD